VATETSGSSTEEIGYYELPAGTYYVQVRAFSSLPSYQLELSGLAPNL
jgi:hypothetical protein